MYSDTVTLFNRYHTLQGDLWYPTVLHGVDLIVDKAAIAAKYGAESSDKARLHVKFTTDGEETIVGGKTWMPPKVWAAQEEEEDLKNSLTFAEGERFDFLYAGEWPSDDPISDDDEEYLEGFFNYMHDTHDFVFVVTSAARYSLIPHFEIIGK